MENYSKGTRRAKDADGKYVEVPADMTYTEWKEKFVDNNPKAQQIIKKSKNKYSDKEQFQKYKAVFGKDFPQSFAKFQEMKYNNSDEWEKFKASKQDTINILDFSQMKNLVGKLGNQEVRLWYKFKDKNIPSLLEQTLSLKEQAVQAHELRNAYRTQARELMKDTEKRDWLNANFPNQPFEYYFNKYKWSSSSEEEIYKKIIDSSTRSNKKFDKEAGIEYDT